MKIVASEIIRELLKGIFLSIVDAKFHCCHINYNVYEFHDIKEKVILVISGGDPEPEVT